MIVGHALIIQLSVNIYIYIFVISTVEISIGLNSICKSEKKEKKEKNETAALPDQNPQHSSASTWAQ